MPSPGLESPNRRHGILCLRGTRVAPWAGTCALARWSENGVESARSSVILDARDGARRPASSHGCAITPIVERAPPAGHASERNEKGTRSEAARGFPGRTGTRQSFLHDHSRPSRQPLPRLQVPNRPVPLVINPVDQEGNLPAPDEPFHAYQVPRFGPPPAALLHGRPQARWGCAADAVGPELARTQLPG